MNIHIRHIYISPEHNFKGHYGGPPGANVTRDVQTAECAPFAMRRNVVVEGVDLNTLIGRTFSIGSVTFEGAKECSPCNWMNEAVAPGAEAFLKGRGGLRARILTNGALMTGDQQLIVMDS